MELHPKLARLLRTRMREFRRDGGNLWSKVVQIVEELGKKDVRTSSDHTTVSYELTFHRDSSICHLSKSNYAYGGDYISVHVDREVVLNMGERDKWSKQDATIADKARMVKIGEQWYLVYSYVPGEWEDWLDLDKIKEQFDKEKARVAQVQTSLRKQEAEQRPLNEQECEIARSFGLSAR